MLFLNLFAFQTSSSFRFIFFAPYLILVIYKKNYPTAISYSLITGLILDLFTSPLRFGVNALNYSLTTTLLYHQRLNFFSDNLLTLPIMTFLFSLLSTLIQVALLYIFSKPIPISIYWIFSDIIMMPLADAFFSFFWFILPSIFIKKPAS